MRIFKRKYNPFEHNFDKVHLKLPKERLENLDQKHHNLFSSPLFTGVGKDQGGSHQGEMGSSLSPTRLSLFLILMVQQCTRWDLPFVFNKMWRDGWVNPMLKGHLFRNFLEFF